MTRTILFRNALLLPLVLILFGGPPAMAQNVDRSDRPATEPMPAVSFPTYHTFSLDNGLKVFLVPDRRPLVTMRLLLRGGSSLDGQRPGQAEFMADLMTKGTSSLDAGAFASEIDFVGGSIGASAGVDNVVVSASGLRSKIDQIAGLFADVIKNPVFDPGELAKYKSLQIEGLKAAKQETGFLAETAMNIVLYGRSSPLAAVPTEELVNAIGRDDLVACHNELIMPNNATLAVVGNFTVDELRSLLEKNLGDWKPGAKAPRTSITVRRMSGNRIILIDRPTSVQSVIRILSPGPLPIDADRPRSILLANILGGGTGLGNRLTMNLRETHGWTYSPYSYFTANSFSGHHLAAADVTNTATDSAVVEMIAEMGRLASEPIDAKELEINVKSAVGSYVMSLARPDATARRVQSIDFHHMPSDYYDRLVSTYNTTTAKDLADLAAKYYRKNDMVIVVVGKASQIKEGLERIGNVEVWDENFEKIESEGAASLSVTADEVWANMLDAMGGKENLRAINSLSARGQGTLSFSGQTFPAAYILLSSKPNNMYQEISATVPGAGLIKIMQQFVTADGASMMQAGRPMPLSDGAIDTMVAASRFLGEAYVEEQGAELTLQSAVKLDGRRYYVVVFAVPGIGERTYYIDAESWLPARIDTDEGQSHQSDWIAVDGGIMRPTKFGVAGEGGSWEFTDIVYDVNLEIPASKFDSGS